MQYLITTIAAIMLTGCVSQIGTKSPEAKVDLEEAKILEVAVKYYDAFINKKYDVIGSITQTPFVSVGNEETLTFQTKDNLIQHMRTKPIPPILLKFYSRGFCGTSSSAKVHIGSLF